MNSLRNYRKITEFCGEIFILIISFLKMRPQHYDQKIVLKNITKTCRVDVASVSCYKCLVNVIRMIVLNLFRYFWSIERILEEVIVIERLTVINRKAIRCALILQQSQFSTSSGPTLMEKSFKKEGT